MKQLKRTVTVIYSYDSVDEAERHQRIMAADGWGAREIDARTTEYTLELAEVIGG